MGEKERAVGFQCTSSFKVTVAFHSAGWTVCALASTVLLAACVVHRQDVLQLPSLFVYRRNLKAEY